MMSMPDSTAFMALTTRITLATGHGQRLARAPSTASAPAVDSALVRRYVSRGTLRPESAPSTDRSCILVNKTTGADTARARANRPTA